MQRLLAGHVTPGEIGGQRGEPGMLLGIAVIMLIPIVMVVLSPTMPYPAIGWINPQAVAAQPPGETSSWQAAPPRTASAT